MKRFQVMEILHPLLLHSIYFYFFHLHSKLMKNTKKKLQLIHTYLMKSNNS
jgi:hypothetical protein